MESNPSTTTSTNPSSIITVTGVNHPPPQPASGKYIPLCTINDLETNGRFRGAIDGRDVTVWKVKDKIYALDSVCYHMGGPLEDGDIEDLHGKVCVVCPWHKYKIELSTGEGLYVDMKNKLCTKGKRQRPHAVAVDKESGMITVKVNTEETDGGEKLPSDHYAYQELYKVKRDAPLGLPGGLRSGSVHSSKRAVNHM